MKKMLLVAAMLLAFVGAKAQTNIQEMYDFGRGHFTTTLEMFKSDPWGSTFFFTDIYHTNVGVPAPTDFYTEIARSLNFWHTTALKDLSLHVEWNGGIGIFDNGFGTSYHGYAVNNAWLYGVEYCFHNANFSKTLTLEAMYKDIRGGSSKVPLQLTAVWGLTNIFGVKGLDFSGFADFWWEDQAMGTSTVFLTEPQLWYNVGQHFACNNLMVGGEVEVSNNFAGVEGWTVRPCLGVKWAF